MVPWAAGWDPLDACTSKGPGDVPMCCQEAGSCVPLLDHPAFMTQRMEIGLRLARAELQFCCS